MRDRPVWDQEERGWRVKSETGNGRGATAAEEEEVGEEGIEEEEDEEQEERNRAMRQEGSLSRTRFYPREPRLEETAPR